jgi:hypothetical protein
MSKMDICLKHALPPGDVLITRRDSIGIIWGSILQQGRIHAQSNSQESVAHYVMVWGKAGNT